MVVSAHGDVDPFGVADHLHDRALAGGRPLKGLTLPKVRDRVGVAQRGSGEHSVEVHAIGHRRHAKRGSSRAVVDSGAVPATGAGRRAEDA